MINNSLDISFDPDTLGGKLYITGTRFTVAQLLAEIADRGLTREIAETFNLDDTQLQKVLHDLSVYIDDCEDLPGTCPHCGR